MIYKGQKYNELINVLILLSITLIAFLPSLKNGFTNWDDNLYIIQNNDIKSLLNFKLFFSNFYLGNYHPLTMLSFGIDYFFYQTNPFGYHLTNLILHLINTFLVFILILKLNFNKQLAFYVALLFGIHTMHVESVAWISERKDLLYVLFLLISSLLYIKYLKTKQIKHYILTLLFFSFSLLSKSQAVFFPIILLLIDYLFSDINKKSLINKIPFIILSIIFIYITVISQNTENAVNLIANNSILNSFINSSVGITEYIYKLLLPIRLSAIYPKIIIINWTHYIYLIAFPIISYVLFISFKNKIKTISFGILFFIISLLPVLQIIPFGDALFADRYSYFSSIGFFIIIIYINQQIFYKLKKLQSILKIIIGIYIFFLVTSTYSRNKVWENSFTLWENALINYPNSYIALTNLASANYDNYNYEKSIELYSKAILVNDKFDKLYLFRALAYSKLKKYEQAIVDYNSSIDINKNNSIAFTNRGLSYHFLSDTISAIRDYNKAILLNPENDIAYTNRGLYYIQSKKYKLAISDFLKAISLNPNNEINYYNIANTYAYLSDFNNALLNYNYAIEKNKDYSEAFYNRGIIKTKMGNKQAGEMDINIAKNISTKLKNTRSK